jgi:hypothetical protein
MIINNKQMEVSSSEDEMRRIRQELQPHLQEDIQQRKLEAEGTLRNRNPLFSAVRPLPTQASSSAAARIKTTSVRQRRSNEKHMSFHDRPDCIRSRYFYFSFVYGLFFVIGAGLGYARKGNLFCLLGSGGIGILLIAISIIHGVDYYKGAPLESTFTAIPLSK